jgi:phosphatidylglycerol:prolipoprotein diacylglycerol transferase
MYPEIHLFGLKIYPYGIMMGLGIVLAMTIFQKKCKSIGYDEDSTLNMAIVCVLSGLLGAKLLFLITEAGAVIKDPVYYIKNIGDGFVLYGAVIGGILAGYLYTKAKKWNFLKVFDIALPLIALGQGLGRIGCFFSGCCYGKETSAPWGIVFRNSPFAPNGVKLVPTQLISSLTDFMIFGILLWFDSKKKSRDGQTGALYLILYSIGRFIIEFFRGDPRGTVFDVLSTSQFICIFVFAAGLILLYSIHKRESINVQEDGISISEKEKEMGTDKAGTQSDEQMQDINRGK